MSDRWQRFTLWFLRLFATFRELEAARDELERRVLVLGVGAYGIESPNGTVKRVEGEVLRHLMQRTPAWIHVVLEPTQYREDQPPGELRVQLTLGGEQ